MVMGIGAICGLNVLLAAGGFVSCVACPVPPRACGIQFEVPARARDGEYCVRRDRARARAARLADGLFVRVSPKCRGDKVSMCYTAGAWRCDCGTEGFYVSELDVGVKNYGFWGFFFFSVRVIRVCRSLLTRKIV